MDSLSSRGLMMAIVLCLCLFNLFEAQLTAGDLKYIKSTILRSQGENGLFGNSIPATYKSIYVLKTLNENVEAVPKICRELSFEAMNGVTLEIAETDALLGCKLSLNVPHEVPEESLASPNLETLCRTVYLALKTNAKVNWALLRENLKTFVTEGKLFSKIAGSNYPSLLSTAHGLSIMHVLHTQLKEQSAAIEEEVFSVLQSLQKESSLIRSDIGLFTEDGVSSIRLNSEFAVALSGTIIGIENLDDVLSKILNYLVTFKYDYTGIDSIYYLIKGINTLSSYPVLSLKKKSFDYLEDSSIQLRILDGFGQERKDFTVEFEYSLKEEEENKPKGDYDLEDEPKEIVTQKTKVENSSEVNLDLSTLINSPGKFTLKVKANFSNNSGTSFEQFLMLDLVSLTKVKLNSLKLSVTNTGDKNDEKEVSVEYPKRTFKNYKATQNSVIKVKVKFTNADNQVNRIEQVFLRLRHVEIGKSYSAYVSEYKSSEDYYYIAFDLSDSSYMDAYDGTYELTLIVSDAALENPMIWSFGKVDVKFKKPLDPTNLSPSYKNIQKEKMEPHFPVEESPNKNIVSSVIFCGLIIFAFVYFLIHLKTNKANVLGFPHPSNKSAFLFSLAFVLFFLMVAYIIILFFLKLNIIQTLIAFLIVGLPGAFVTYKALSKIKIEV